MKTYDGTTKSGLNYLFGILTNKKTVVSRVAFWRIPHTSEKEDVRLKIGRYKKTNQFDNAEDEIPEVNEPKSALTLDSEEFHNLIEFLQDNYEPFRKGIKDFIPVTTNLDGESIEHLKAIFLNSNKAELLDFVVNNDILPENLILSLQQIKKINAVKEFECILQFKSVPMCS